MKILLFGANGQVGWQLRRSLAPLGEVVPADLRQAAAIPALVDLVQPDLIVNAAAYTAVDKAEDERQAAFEANARAPSVLAAECERRGIWLVHYSSDYVYDGSGDEPWVESDPTGPLGVYGASKLAGDEAVAGTCSRYLILRTSWVFDTFGGNFVKSILRAAATRDSLNVVCDQWGAPTRAALIADVTALALARPETDRPAGIYHLAPHGTTNWHAYATLAVQTAIEQGLKLKATPETIRPIPAADYPVKARRPANSRLDTRKLQSTFGLRLPQWEDGVRAVVTELAAHQAWLNP
jgi:dTDP-4-dehydrorhamnose reductase